jgi:CBS domain-containing protein
MGRGPRADPGRVRDWMTRAPLAVGPEAPLHQVARLMRQARIRHVVVVEGDRLVGIVSDRDVRGLRLEDEPQLGPDTPVRRVMTEEPFVVGPDTPLTEAARALLEQKIGALPVVEEGRPVGILTRADALEALLAALEGTPD